MKKRRKNKGRSLAAFVCSGLLSAGIILPYMSCRPFVRAVRAEEILQKTEKQLEAGDNVKGEAVVFAADSDSTTYAAKGDDLLDRAEEIFRVDSGIENPANASSASNAAGGPSEPKRIQGAIKLVKSSFMSTQELIEALYENPRVVYAEPNYLMDDSSDEKNEEGKEIPVQQERFEKNSAENDSSGPKALEDGQSGKKDDEPVKEEKKEETASEQADASEPEGEQENRQEDKPQQQEAEDQKLTPSNFGPSDYTPGQIPDMTQWQWGNWNNGSLAGTYTHSGQVDVQYEEWKTQTKEQMPEYVVAVLDSGIDETSPDLAEVLWTGDIFGSGGDSHGCFQRQWHSGSSTSMITNFHGTHIAGIIAGQWNGQGISGIASNVKLMSLRHDSTFATVLACMSYAKKAVKQGVNLIAVNNSWRMGSDTSNLINLAVTELGEMGVVSVFASGNDAANTDQIFDTPAVVANNPYTVVVNAVGPDGTKAGYSNYGLQTTDVMAPGSSILSTVLNRYDELNFLGEANAHAPEGSEARDNLVSYTSFDDQSVNPFESFSIFTDKSGTSWGSELNYPVIQPAAGTFDGTGALSVKTDDYGMAAIVSSVKDLSGLETKPRYLSCRTAAEQPDQAVRSVVMRIPVTYTCLDGPAIKRNKLIEASKTIRLGSGTYSGYEFDLSEAETLTEKEKEEGMTGCYIDWNEFSFLLNAFCFSENSLKTETIYFDSIALGSCRYPYRYFDGTSMAAPAAAGVLAVIAGQHADSLGERQTSSYAEKLAALVKGGAVTRPEYDQLCATSGFVSVEGANQPGPVIAAVEDGLETFTLSGYFLDQAAVTLDGAFCSYTAGSSENDRSVLTVQKPEGFQGGTPVIAVQGPNGKMDRSVVNISAASGKDTPGLYDYVNIPLPDGIDTWMNHDLTGYNRRIYILPRSDESESRENADSIFAYNPESGSWDEIQIPLKELAPDELHLFRNVIDITACAKDGKLILLLTGLAFTGDYSSQLISMDAEGNFEALGSGVSFVDIPAFGTLVSNGCDLYLAGGVTSKDEKGSSSQASWRICRLSAGESKKLTAEPCGEMTVPRVMPRASFSNGRMIISGGLGADLSGSTGNVAAEGVEQFVIGEKKAQKIDLKPLENDLKNLEFSSGALKDGTFLLAGPASKDGQADTYVLNRDLTLEQYDKRAWSSNLLKPASAAYNNAFYVLAKIAPSGVGLPALVFSSTAVNASVPAGDALVKTIKSAPAKTGPGMPELKNTDLSVTQKDLHGNLKGQAQKVIDQINQTDKDSEAYLEADRLAESDVPQTEKDVLLSAAGREKMNENLFWMDLAMYLQIPEQDKIGLTDNQAGTKVSIQIPDFPELQKGYARSWKIFAYNSDEKDEDRKAEIITPEFDAQNRTLSFNWKKSSVYAIGYLDTKDADPTPAPDPYPDSAPDPVPTPESAQKTDSAPVQNSKLTESTTLSTPAKTASPASSNSATAAETNVVFWCGLTAAGGLMSAALAYARKKKK